MNTPKRLVPFARHTRLWLRPRRSALAFVVAVAALTMLSASAWGEDAVAEETHSPKRIGLGVEADVLPYALSGAHGDVWAGLDSWRARAIAVTFTTPSFFTPSGFVNGHTTILELEIDRFFGPRAAEFRGPWVAAGGGVSILTIDANDRSGHGSVSAFELSTGVGWAFPLAVGFYLDPWVGATYQFASSSQVGTQNWQPARFAPQLGMKVGWNLSL